MGSIADVSARRTPRLSPAHRRMLEEASAIARDVLEESGVYTVTDGHQLPKGFSGRQRRRGSGLLFTVTRPNRGTAWVFRPDEADLEHPGLRYEATCKKLGGPGNVLYVHPSHRHLIADISVPVVFVEGIKKALAIVSAARSAGVEVLVVGILGVWNFLSKGKPIPDMLEMPLEARKVYICYDSDVFTNPDVAGAARRLAGYVEGRGSATVELAYLPAGPEGSKTGADDFLARGNGYRELAATFRPFDPADLAAERLKRGDLLRAMLQDLGRALWASEWKGVGGHSSRDVFKVLVDVAADRGKLHRDGLRVPISRGELARMAKVSTRTLQKAIERLEEMGLVYRDNEGRRPRQRGAFVLRAGVNHYEERPGIPTAKGDGGKAPSVSSLHLRAPRLRWSDPGRKGRRGVVRGTRQVRLSLAMNSRPAVKRLGKIRGAVVDALDAAGGSLPMAEICEVLHRSRSRDLVRFQTSEKGHDGPLVMLLEAGIVQWVSDIETHREILRLTPDWLQRLDEARQLAGETDSEVLSGRHDAAGRSFLVRRKGAATLQRERLQRRSEAFRRQDEYPVSPHYVNVPGADGHVAELHLAGESDAPAAENAPVSPLAEVIRRYLDLHPGDACQPPGWIGTTLWAYELHPGKPGPADIRAAIEELGGEGYLRERLQAAKVVAA